MSVQLTINSGHRELGQSPVLTLPVVSFCLLQVFARWRVETASGHPRGAGSEVPVGGLLLQQSTTLLPGHRHPEHCKSSLITDY